MNVRNNGKNGGSGARGDGRRGISIKNTGTMDVGIFCFDGQYRGKDRKVAKRSAVVGVFGGVVTIDGMPQPIGFGITKQENLEKLMAEASSKDLGVLVY